MAIGSTDDAMTLQTVDRIVATPDYRCLRGQPELAYI